MTGDKAPNAAHRFCPRMQYSKPGYKKADEELKSLILEITELVRRNAKLSEEIVQPSEEIMKLRKSMEELMERTSKRRGR